MFTHGLQHILTDSKYINTGTEVGTDNFRTSSKISEILFKFWWFPNFKKNENCSSGEFPRIFLFDKCEMRLCSILIIAVRCIVFIFYITERDVTYLT